MTNSVRADLLPSYTGTVDILIPYRPSTPLRRRAYDAVRAYHDCYSGWSGRVIVADDPSGGLFACGRAVNAALAASTAEIVVYQDADSLVPFPQIVAAVDRAAATGSLVKAFTHYHRLRPGFGRLRFPWPKALRATVEDIEWSQSPVCAMGVSAVDREAWLSIGGFDPRFDGWGYDDIALETLAGATIGIDRIEGPLFHIHHERREEEQPEAPSLIANERLNHRYDAEAENAEGLLAIRREAPWPC